MASHAEVVAKALLQILQRGILLVLKNTWTPFFNTWECGVRLANTLGRLFEDTNQLVLGHVSLF